MDLDLDKIPDDARITKQDLACLVNLIEQKYQEKIAYLEERVRLLQNEIFGRRTEKHYPQDHLQMPLFPSVGKDTSTQELLGCRFTGSKRSLRAWASKCPGQRWPTGPSPPPNDAAPCSI